MTVPRIDDTTANRAFSETLDCLLDATAGQIGTDLDDEYDDDSAWALVRFETALRAGLVAALSRRPAGATVDELTVREVVDAREAAQDFVESGGSFEDWLKQAANR